MIDSWAGQPNNLAQPVHSGHVKPSTSDRKAIPVFEPRLRTRSQRGSHAVLRNPDPLHRRLVDFDDKSLAKGTLHALIREAGMTVKEFVALVWRTSSHMSLQSGWATARRCDLW